MEYQQQCEKNPQKESATNKELNTDKKITNNDIFLTEEITIEEMAIDGICGVY